MDMTPEFIMLAFTLILALVQIGLATVVRTSELGAKWNAGPRDAEVPPPGKLAGRLMRAQANLFETLPIFAAAVIMAHIAGKDGFLTALGAHLYFFARVIYVPLYAFGVPYIRTLVWLVAAAGLVMVLAALFV
ncbi:MAPEG family protein [Brevundimonas lenta]|uniref:Putative MAPEG superfamily protein n=1 Tax=Brevundimonas lenta TaxID=424796 RepID=A0A7W6JFN3_9CAUL|nr:MAPEG family protein [Brevundimonas lenta]MBB4083263.1 putative MAPEG superfamily protein [Brevundimonas lenta]